MLPTEYILTMGYFPDRFADHKVGPDIFFNHVYMQPEMVQLIEEAQVWEPHRGRVEKYERALGHYWFLLESAVESLRTACIEKYRLTALPPQDTFWECSGKPIDGSS